VVREEEAEKVIAELEVKIEINHQNFKTVTQAMQEKIELLEKERANMLGEITKDHHKSCICVYCELVKSEMEHDIND
jgi:hypothetical protein